MLDGVPRTCLVLTTSAPAATEVRNHTDGLMEFLLEPALAPRYDLVRMDAISEPGRLSDAVLRGLRNAAIVVADLSFSDPSVMYALGVRHTLGMSAVHVHTPNTTFPFDIEGMSAVVIDLADMSSVKRARKELQLQVARLEDEAPDPSPVLATLQLDAMRSRTEPAPDASTAAAVVNGIKAIEQRLAVMEMRYNESQTVRSIRPRRVLIVHGHDGELKHQLARVLSDLQFEVVISQEIADSGRTLFDKLRTEIDEIGYVFVLLTPDDIAASKHEPDQLCDRARQNVIFEHGLFTGLLDSSRVCTIQRGEVELPSDLHGLVVKQIPDGSGIEAIQLDVVNELKRAGYDVDANQLVR